MQFSHNEHLNRWETAATVMGREVKLRVDRSFDESDLPDIVNAAITKIENNIQRIQQNIVDALLETYNDCWADPDDEELPEMNAETFLSRIALESINVGEEQALNLYFADSDLFGGHAIDVFWLANDKMYEASLLG